MAPNQGHKTTKINKGKKQLLSKATSIDSHTSDSSLGFNLHSPPLWLKGLGKDVNILTKLEKRASAGEGGRETGIKLSLGLGGRVDS